MEGKSAGTYPNTIKRSRLERSNLIFQSHFKSKSGVYFDPLLSNNNMLNGPATRRIQSGLVSNHCLQNSRPYAPQFIAILGSFPKPTPSENMSSIGIPTALAVFCYCKKFEHRDWVKFKWSYPGGFLRADHPELPSVEILRRCHSNDGPDINTRFRALRQWTHIFL